MNPPQRICPYCRSQVSPAARFCGSCGRTLVVSDSDETIVTRHPPPGVVSSYPPPAQPSTPPAYPNKRGQKWLPVLGIALVFICCVGALMAAGGWFGLRRGWTVPVSGLSNPTPAQLRLEPLLSESLQPSDQPQTVTWSDQVAVTVPGGLLPSAQTLTISAVPDAPPPLANNIYTSGGVYDVSLGDVTRFAQPLTIELAYDPAKLSPDLPVADQLAWAYWEPQSQAWSFIPAQVDENRRVAIIETTHLTAFGWYYINVKDYTAKHLSPQFRVIYNPNLNAALNVPGKGLKSGIEEYAYYTWLAIDQAYRKYKDAGFRLPNYRVDVIVGDWSSSSASPSAGVIYVVYDADYPEMAFDAAHELFHLVQYQYLDGNEMEGVRWWMEVTADYAAGRVAWLGNGDIEKKMGEGIKAKYLDQSIEYLSEDTGDTYYRHQYHTAYFLEFVLAGTSGGQNQAKAFSDMWGYVTAEINENDDNWYAEEEDLAGDWDVTVHLAKWLGNRERLNAAYREFAAYYLFNATSPLPIPADAAAPDKVPAEAAAQWSYLKMDDEETTSQSFDLPWRYSAKVWGVVVEVDPAEAARSVSVSGVGSWPQDVSAHVFVLPGDRRVNLGYGQGPPPQASLTSAGPVQVDVSQGDGLYVLVINSGDRVQQVSLKITAEDKKTTPTPENTLQGKWVLADPIVQPPELGDWPTSCAGFHSEFTATSASLTWPQRSCTCPVVTFTHDWPKPPAQLEPGQTISMMMSTHWTVAPGCDEKDWVGTRSMMSFEYRWRDRHLGGAVINNTGQTNQPPTAPKVETISITAPPHPDAPYITPIANDTFEVIFTTSVDFSNQFEGQVKYIYTFQSGTK